MGEVAVDGRVGAIEPQSAGLRLARCKRLAVEVEDHPLEYGRFEGIIPEGNYGAGPVVIWDSGSYRLIKADFSSGRVEFFLEGTKLKGAFVLTRLKGKERDWLMIKKSDEFAREKFEIVPELTPARLRSLHVRIPPCETS